MAGAYRWKLFGVRYDDTKVEAARSPNGFKSELICQLYGNLALNQAVNELSDLYPGEFKRAELVVSVHKKPK